MVDINLPDVPGENATNTGFIVYLFTIITVFKQNLFIVNRLR